MGFVMDVFDNCISFAKEKLDTVMNFWEELEDDKKKSQEQIGGRLPVR